MSRKQERDKKRLIKLLFDMPIISIACAQIGLPRSTYYRWRKEDEQFAIEADIAQFKGEEAMIDLAESKLISKIKDSDIRAIEFFLRNRSPKYGYPKLLPANKRDSEYKYIEVADV